MALMMVIVRVALAFLIAWATGYLICGLCIRKGGHISVIVALVMASIHFLWALLHLVSDIAGMVAGRAGGQTIFWFIIALVSAGAAGPLMYYLIKILKEPQGRIAR